MILSSDQCHCIYRDLTWHRWVIWALVAGFIALELHHLTEDLEFMILIIFILKEMTWLDNPLTFIIGFFVVIYGGKWLLEKLFGPTDNSDEPWHL